MFSQVRGFVIAILLPLVFLPAFAGKSGSSGGKSHAAPSRSSVSVSSASRGPLHSSASRHLGGNTRMLQQKGRQSLISGGEPQPSQKVTQIIRERESSGPGWLGTAFLISLLSRHDLSSSDKSWIQNKINSIKAEGDDETPGLLPALTPGVVYQFSGLENPLVVGEPANVAVSATMKGHAVPVTCSHAGITNQGERIEIAWTPDVPGVSFLTCKVGNHQAQERRLVRVVAKNV